MQSSSAYLLVVCAVAEAIQSGLWLILGERNERRWDRVEGIALGSRRFVDRGSVLDAGQGGAESSMEKKERVDGMSGPTKKASQ